MSLALAALALAAQAPSFARTESLALEPGTRARSAACADLDGDGAVELLLTVVAAGKTRLETWKRSSTGTLTRTDVLALPADVVAFAHGDVLDGGGEELILFNAGGAFVWRSEAPPVLLARAEFLWQSVDPDEVFDWSAGVRDLDRDGRADIVLPEPAGLRVVLRRPGDGADAPWGREFRLEIPRQPGVAGPWSPERGEREGVESRSENGSFSLGVRLQSGDERQDSRALVDVAEKLPAPNWIDWDADGDLDLLLQTERSVLVWLQQDGGFARAPALTLPLPVAADESRELDASYDARTLDLDLDRRADYAVFASDKRSDDLRVQALFFTQAKDVTPPLFGPAGIPAQLLVFNGLVQSVDLRDLDGDGAPELIVQTLRPDLIDQLRNAASESIDVELFVYRNRRGLLAKSPELVRKQREPLGEGETSAQFVGDVDGDGLAELLERDEPTHLALYSLRAEGSGENARWKFRERPSFELSVAKDAKLEFLGEGRRGWLLVFESAQVLCVRFE